MESERSDGSEEATLLRRKPDLPGGMTVGFALRVCGVETTAVSPDPCVAYVGCRSDAPVVWCEFDGCHEWPDFARTGIWDFFAGLE